MRRIIIAVLVLTGVLMAVVPLRPRPAAAALIRKPVWAGKFYPADRGDLEKTIAQLIAKTRQTKVNIPRGRVLKALILPHAGYVYSGLTAAHAVHALKDRRFSKVVLMGPDHRVGFRNGAISDAKAWETPLGLVKIHRDAEALKKRSERFRAIPKSDRMEHSLEVVLPFLQYFRKDFELVPIVFGSGDPRRLATDIAWILNDETLVVVSSDLSHYLPYTQAVEKDRETIQTILDLKPEALAKKENCACGRVPIMVVMELALRRGWQPLLLHYANSGDTAGGRDRVVGYAAIAFYGDTMEKTSKEQKRFSEEEGQALVRLARRTIGEKLGYPGASNADEEKLLSEACFDAELGTFVTLTIDGRLRGCIGSLTGSEPLREGVRRNAVNAAFKDPRFPPITKKEFEKIDIEVSILTEPRALSYDSAADLTDRLRVNVDGVILQKGGARATFLPQVWQQLPEPDAFLSRLCMKAGLPADAWQHTGLDVFTYQVQYFEEHR